MKITLIAAVSQNGVISACGRLPWDLPEDKAFFRRRTAGAWLLVGRETWEEMDGWFQPGHTVLVLTSRADLPVPGGRTVASAAEAINLAEQGGAEELMVIGGAQVFAAALPFADTLLLTRVHTEVPGDRFFPALRDGEWEVADSVFHPADGRHAHPFTFLTLVRRRFS